MPCDPLSAPSDPPTAATPTGGSRSGAVAPPATVEEVLELRIALDQDLVGEVRTRFRYAAAAPYEVRLTFHLGRPDEADWVFSRDLLRDGLQALSGQGDVKLWPAQCPCHGPTLHLALQSPHGSALLEASQPQVRAWLERTYRVVPDGSIEELLPSDEELAELLAGG
ncbi:MULTISPECIES: SsgA family sporulation/cell division regulator [Kitasatospora]|uniref:Putative sporulation and cell division protein n=1 Tax=Kitasatospora setae (strain ATCC 33774 / DSM 43861 / JCM 3304 / KCC A-0304 / NBRC 14216 / KM-6054) TaxID=452652 RepID=E4N027_KITSK|nr:MULTISPECIES: SsgA family sporulation/cell division regulator [Kitasatospora]BAJ31355.1 putative sporulation and cell division protein [Kitasatospora setae KM-6054]